MQFYAISDQGQIDLNIKLIGDKCYLGTVKLETFERQRLLPA